jgi:hypothetical protein
MRFSAFLLGILLPGTASAEGLADIGNGYAASTWAQACTILPYCGMGANGIVIITGIVINTILWLVGSAAVIVILYAAIRMITSAGNDETVRKAWKETILYAALGLIATVLADAIINYVFSLVTGIAAS